jgi:adenylate cyclase
MNLELKSRKFLKIIPLLFLGSFAVICFLWLVSGKLWNDWNYRALDYFYRFAVNTDRGPTLSSNIVYTVVTDDSYRYFQKNILDREDLARVNEVLAELGAESVAYDIIFAHPSIPDADHKFADSISKLGNVYLPIGLEYTDYSQSIKWESGRSFERLESDCLFTPVEEGHSNPFYASRVLMQAAEFSNVAAGMGHISAYADPDGAYRHVILLIRVKKQYVPTLALAMFLDHAGISASQIKVKWGDRIIIPQTSEGNLEEDVIIPIDDRGRAFVPFVHMWDRGFKIMEAHKLLKYYEDENLRGNLLDFFEGNFVFIGDISSGVHDVGNTPLESDVPLIVLHTSLLNGLLTNTFYEKWSTGSVLVLIGLCGFLLGISAIPKSSWVLYIVAILILTAIPVITWVELINFRLFPIITVGGSVFFVLFVIIVGLEVGISRERTFIKNAFSRYVPKKVVNELLAKPELLKLGGEERTITVLFSDLENFTSLSEKMSPRDLTMFLNEYLTEMSSIVLKHGGIIDKYQGDSIMAEFGAPLPMVDHADQAVKAGLGMLKLLETLHNAWQGKLAQEIKCRIGINTGSMIIGNMGSTEIFDYTVVGDSVNLASRLEGENKRYNTYLMISEYTYNSLTPDLFRIRILDVIKVRGRSEAVKVYEVYGLISELIEPTLESYYRNYQEGYEAYLSRRYEEALEKFQTALSCQPRDFSAKRMIDRIAKLKMSGSPEDRDGHLSLS